jgi:hypothetical protein
MQAAGEHDLRHQDCASIRHAESGWIPFCVMGMENVLERMRVRTLLERFRLKRGRLSVIFLLAIFGASAICVAGSAAPQSSKEQWKTLPFAIVRYNDDAPKSWNVYRGDRKGIYLVRLWKRYLLIDTDSQSAFEIDPGKVTVQGEKAELASSDIPAEPIETTEWKTRNAGPVLRHRFRFGASGNYMELQIPVLPNGKPAY